MAGRTSQCWPVLLDSLLVTFAVGVHQVMSLRNSHATERRFIDTNCHISIRRVNELERETALGEKEKGMADEL